MGALQIVGLFLLPFAWMLIAAINKEHKHKTGVNMPSRSAMKGIRKRAKKADVSEAEYYDGWVARKQKREGVVIRNNVSATPEKRLTFAPLPPKSEPPERTRAPEHKPFDFDHLVMMAEGRGWTIKKQAFDRYYMVGKGETMVVNPYAGSNQISTDFTHRDLEDFLLTC